MAGKTKTCISRYLGGLGRGGGCSSGNMVSFWFIIVTMLFEERMIVSPICFAIC
jgi:hypothetical protein